MRIYLQGLTKLGVIERRRHQTFPPTVECTLTDAGRALLKVGGILRTWLTAAPEGAIPFGTPAAKQAIRALVEGWSTNMVRALAARPYSLTELSKMNVKISYPALERRLSAMRLVNLVEPQPGEGRSTPCRATEWLRRAAAPLVATMGWERQYLADVCTQSGRLDVEAVFLLAAPLMTLASDRSGTCRLSVELPSGPEPTYAGVVMGLEGGKLVSCSVRLEGTVDAWTTGSAMAWLRQMSGEPALHLELGGDRQLAESIIEALRATGCARTQELESVVD
jgi:DNA-binding HxlR family transcriptional regulator